MNITQIMNLYSWGGEAGIEHRSATDNDAFNLALSKTVGEYGTVLDIDGALDPFVVFNHATSEVLLFILHDDVTDIATVYSSAPSALLTWCLENADHPVDVVDGDTILSMVAKSVGKEDDVEMNFDIDAETLARLDQLAAETNLTRSGIITKALIEAIATSSPTANDEPIVVGFNYILTAIRNHVPVQFYNTTFDCWVGLTGACAEIRERDYHVISSHFEDLDWRIKPTTT